MNVRPDVERRISTWLDAEIETRASDRLIDAARDRIALTSQRRRWLVRAWVDGPAIAVPRTVLAAGFTMAVISATLLLVPRALPGFGGGPPGDSTARPTASSSMPSPRALTPGTHTTQQFGRQIRFTVPTGWTVFADTATGLRLDGLEPPAHLDVCLDPQASDPLQNVPVDGVGRTSDELIRHLLGRFDYRILRGPIDIEIDGLTGASLELQGLGADAPEVALLASQDAPSACALSLYGTESIRIGFVDLPDGTTLAFMASSFDGPAARDAGWRVVESFRINQTPTTPSPS